MHFPLYKIRIEIKMNNRGKRRAFRSYPTEESGLCTAAPMRSPPSRQMREGGLDVEESLDPAKYSILKMLQCAKMMNIFR